MIEIIRILLGRPVAFHASLARLFRSVNAGLFLSQLIYWSDKGADPEGWIYKTQKEWSDETCLSRREQETARRILKSAKVIEERQKGVPKKLYFRVIFAGLADLLQSGGNEHSSMAESASQEWRKAPRSNGGKRHTITENTIDYTETTTLGASAPSPKGNAKSRKKEPKYDSETFQKARGVFVKARPDLSDSWNGAESAGINACLDRSKGDVTKIEAKIKDWEASSFWGRIPLTPQLLGAKWNSIPVMAPGVGNTAGVSEEEKKRMLEQAKNAGVFV